MEKDCKFCPENQGLLHPTINILVYLHLCGTTWAIVVHNTFSWGEYFFMYFHSYKLWTKSDYLVFQWVLTFIINSLGVGSLELVSRCCLTFLVKRFFYCYFFRSYKIGRRFPLMETCFLVYLVSLFNLGFYILILYVCQI